MTRHYEFRVAGRLGPVVLSALPELAAVDEPAHTVLRGSGADFAELGRLLDWLRRHDLRAVRIRIECDAASLDESKLTGPSDRAVAP